MEEVYSEGLQMLQRLDVVCVESPPPSAFEVAADKISAMERELCWQPRVTSTSPPSSPGDSDSDESVRSLDLNEEALRAFKRGELTLSSAHCTFRGRDCWFVDGITHTCYRELENGVKVTLMQLVAFVAHPDTKFELPGEWLFFASNVLHSDLLCHFNYERALEVLYGNEWPFRESLRHVMNEEFGHTLYRDKSFDLKFPANFAFTRYKPSFVLYACVHCRRYDVNLYQRHCCGEYYCCKRCRAQMGEECPYCDEDSMFEVPSEARRAVRSVMCRCQMCGGACPRHKYWSEHKCAKRVLMHLAVGFAAGRKRGALHYAFNFRKLVENADDQCFEL